MAKKHTIELHYKDLYADIGEHPNDVIGAWIKILCKVWQKDDSGRLELSLSQFARIIGESEKETNRLLAYIASEDIATIMRQDKKILLINRRSARDAQGPKLIRTPAGSRWTIEQCKDAGFTVGLTEKESEAAFIHFDMQGWLRKNGMPVTNIISCMTYWRNHQHEFKDEKKGTPKLKTGDYK